jgi:hypothetical protein
MNQTACFRFLLVELLTPLVLAYGFDRVCDPDWIASARFEL